MQIRIYYEDTDCGGIVYHTNYIKYCERARSEIFFQKLMLPQKENCGFVVSALEAQFLGVARLGDLLEVRSRIAKISRVQLWLHQEIFKIKEFSNSHIQDRTQDANNQKPIFSCDVRLAYVDAIKQKPMPIPQDLLAPLCNDV